MAALKAKAGATPGAVEELERRGHIAQAVLDVLTARRDVAKGLADAAHARAQLVLGEVGRCSETATLTALAHAPDTAARWLVNHAASAWRDDQLTIGLTAHGLLSSSNALATDQTAAVILSLAQSFAATRAPVPQSFRLLSQRAATPDSRTPCEAYKTTALFDPTRRSEVVAAASQLKAATANLGLCVEGLGSEPNTLEPDRVVPGYAYRAAKPVRVTVTQGEQTDVSRCKTVAGQEAASLVVTVPDAATLFVTPVEAATFTKVSNKHTFKDGMLVEMSMDKPSTGLALASLPVDILKALVSIPASILKLRVDYETQSAAVVTQQANVLKAQLELLEAQKKLEDRLAQPAATP